MAPRISQVERYIFWPLLWSVSVGLLVFILLWMAPEAFFKIVQAVQAGSISLKTGAYMLILQIPSIVIYALPMASLMGSVFVVRRLNQDLEWVAFLSLGIPYSRIYRPFLVLGAGLLLTMVAIQNVFLPWAQPKLMELQEVYDLKSKAPVSALLATPPQEADNTEGLLLLGNVKTDRLAEDVVWLRFTQNPNPALMPYISHWTTAERLRLLDNASQEAVFEEAADIELGPEGRIRQSDKSKQAMTHRLANFQPLFAILEHPPEGQHLRDLFKAIPVLRHYKQFQTLGGVDNAIWDRLTSPLAIPILLLMGIPMALEGPRKRTTQPFTLAALALFIYLVARPLASQLASTGMLAGSLAAFIPLVGLLMFYVFLLKRQHSGE
jgi:lipopolysaccharide export LptBFGC system permease protein LptF